jgi:hypothetical protein
MWGPVLAVVDRRGPPDDEGRWNYDSRQSYVRRFLHNRAKSAPKGMLWVAAISQTVL